MEKENNTCSLKADPKLFARLSRLVATCDSIDVVLQTIVEEAVLACDAVRGFLAIVDHERGELDARYTAGEGWSEEKRLCRLKVTEETGRGITSHVAATASSYLTPNVLEDPYYLMSFEDVRSEVAVPLVDSFQRTRGVMNIESTKLAAFDESHICTLEGLADLGTIAMTMADHRSRETALVRVGKELNGLTKTSAIMQKVINVAAEALKFEDCSLFLIDEVSGKLILRASRGNLKPQVSQAAYDIGQGLTGWVAQNQKSVRVADPTCDPRWRGRFEELPASEVGAFMAVPIFSHNGVTGVLRVQRKRSTYKWFPNQFTEDEEQILSTIASQLGIALDNSHLIDRLVKTERMAAWGELSSRSAHMIGNRVFAIKGDINELEYLLGSGDIDSKAAFAISESIKKGIYLLEDILVEYREFVKATHLDMECVDLNTLIQESIDEGFPKRSQTKLEVKLADNLPKIIADPKKIKRCFSELLENSVHFQPDGGDILVTTSLADARSKRWLKPSDRDGTYVLARFQDNGPGINSDNKPKIFNPFFSSRAKGMGLGLSIVKGIVNAHKGIIVETGKFGKGAIFSILLPVPDVEC